MEPKKVKKLPRPGLFFHIDPPGSGRIVPGYSEEMQENIEQYRILARAYQRLAELQSSEEGAGEKGKAKVKQVAKKSTGRKKDVLQKAPDSPKPGCSFWGVARRPTASSVVSRGSRYNLRRMQIPDYRVKKVSESSSASSGCSRLNGYTNHQNESGSGLSSSAPKIVTELDVDEDFSSDED